MPKSKTKMSRRNRIGTGPKSRDSQRKLRRWTFTVEARKADGQSTSFNPPALSIGNYEVAKNAANSMRNDIKALPQFAETEIVVRFDGHEVISQEILNQINGLSKQAETLAQAFHSAVCDVVAGELPKDKPAPSAEELKQLVDTRVQGYMQAEQDKKHRQELINAGIDPDAQPVVNTPVPAEFAVVAAEATAEPFPDGEFGKEVAA